MKTIRCLLLILLPALTASASAPAPVLTPGWGYTELRRWPAAEARQAVVADGEFLYVISNHAIGKYRQATGERAGGWECAEGRPLIHLNAGFLHAGRLYGSHSNYPGVPHVSSIEIWDPATLRHIGSHSFGRTDGSLTWLTRHAGRWMACFVHYGNKGGEPGRGPEWTRLVALDDEWREVGGWTFPAALLAQLGTGGFSVSGGAFGPGGYLYVTGHDNPALYVLTLPEGGTELRWVATVPVMAEGQGFAWDPQTPEIVYTLLRSTKEIVAGRITLPAAP